MMKNFIIIGLLLFLFSCDTSVSSSEKAEEKKEEVPTEKTIWKGTKKTVTKGDNTDSGVEANQDRITDKVWLTRLRAGGGFINKKAGETSYNKTTSPAGTKWAEGSLDNLDSLDFKSGFHNLMKPKSAVNKNLVLWLIEENIFISVKITSWSSGKKGGFTYERSTK